MTSKRATILLRRFATARVDLATENKHRGARRWLHRKLKAWWAGMSVAARTEIGRLLEEGRPLLTRHFVGAPSALGRVGQMVVDSPAPRSRLRRREIDRRRARKARGRFRRREREAG